MRQVAQFALIGIAALFSLIALVPEADAQTQIGGVSVEGEWFVGEGLKIGDYFSYNMCYVNYKECKEFKMEFWIEGEKTVGNENKWVASTVVYDGNKIIKGTMDLGKIAPEPTGGSPELLHYRSAFKSSIVWLSAFATSYGGSGGEGPKNFSDPSWGKIANIGGQQILPTEVRTIRTRAGVFEDAISVTWRTGGVTSAVWIVDDFPFPIKARTFVHVSEGIPPTEYEFEILAYKNTANDPFTNVVPTVQRSQALGCPEDPQVVKTKRGTERADYLVNFQHGPERPLAGCDMTLLISFHNKFDETEFLNQVQYDIVVTDSDDEIVYTHSKAEGEEKIFSASGQTRNNEMWVPDEPGDYVYVIVIYGLAPENRVPTTKSDVFRVPITVVANPRAVPTPAITPTTPTLTPDPASIPSWIKTTAGFWADGRSTDAEFVNAIEFLISRNVIVVGDVESPTGGSNASIPSWIKTTTKFWADGSSSDAEFVSAIEFLISKGVIVIR